MDQKEKAHFRSNQFLVDHFLIAMPGMGDPRFDRSVIYLCSHSPSGAMGIVINNPLEDLILNEVLHQLVGAVMPDKPTNYPDGPDQTVYYGGPVERGRGLVLHSSDYDLEASMDVSPDIRLTSSIEVLEDIAKAQGPKHALLALGYAGWSAGQLEAEIAANGWLTCKATPDIVFDHENDSKYDRALALLGIDAALLSADAGHA